MMLIESMILEKNVNEICHYVAKLRSKTEKEKFIKDIIQIYIEHFSIHNNVYTSEFMWDRLLKLLQFDALFHKFACEICVMCTYFTIKHIDLEKKNTQCIQDCITYFPTVIYQRSLEEILYCIDVIQTYTEKNFLTTLKIKQVENVVDPKYADDSVWWMWNSIYQMLTLTNNKLLNNYIKHAIFIFRTYFNKQNRKHRISFMKKIMCNICLFQNVVYIPCYNPLLIQIMMKINFIADDYVVSKKLTLLYYNVLYNILPHTIHTNTPITFNHVEEIKTVTVNKHRIDSENKCLISKINEE